MKKPLLARLSDASTTPSFVFMPTIVVIFSQYTIELPKLIDQHFPNQVTSHKNNHPPKDVHVGSAPNLLSPCGRKAKCQFNNHWKELKRYYAIQIQSNSKMAKLEFGTKSVNLLFACFFPFAPRQHDLSHLRSYPFYWLQFPRCGQIKDPFVHI